MRFLKSLVFPMAMITAFVVVPYAVSVMAIDHDKVAREAARPLDPDSPYRGSLRLGAEVGEGYRVTSVTPYDEPADDTAEAAAIPDNSGI